MGTVGDLRANDVRLDGERGSLGWRDTPGRLRLFFGRLGPQLLPEGATLVCCVESLTGASLAGRGAAAGLGGNKGVCCGTPPRQKKS